MDPGSGSILFEEQVATFPTGTLEFGCDLTPDRKTLICAVQEQYSDAWLAEHFDPQSLPR